ncbi:MAG: pyridoxal-dependent decarboxylase [Gammaproteobacteria bacterium]|nr:pyridoxal-dependent decarboxylase [Gammaproteobacteria bacterium]MDH4254971.1 pyridoxal-dependent decarboxylase [Gammaproteobacteria bacterium]MDH5310214.1 pyridoxal-dependent decarboxylase [Gammaproteobacteria bacterium]
MDTYEPGTDLRLEMEQLIGQLQRSLSDVIRSTDERIALPPGAAAALEGFYRSLPETGCGAAAALEELQRLNELAGGNTAGPRCYHFVIGGSTPAALGADLLASAYDAVTYTWILSPVGVEMERQALDWLKELLGLPASWSGVMVTGASMANFVGLAAARQWWGEQQGFDVSETGLAGLPQVPVLTSGFVHASTLKVLALQGIGRGSVQRFCRDDFGRVDLEGFRQGLERLEGKPALVVVNAGEVNAGEFDPVGDMIDLARAHNCWVHVDGAFGLFAAVSPRTAQLVEGAARADSATVDGHKWLNVPYDSGYAFVRDYGLLARAFRYSADYLPDENDARPTYGAIGPESSRRARSFAVWATLKAYGREGHRRIVEHCLDIAQHFAAVVRATPGLELMNDPKLNIVSFRYNPGGLADAELDELNRRLGQAVLDDGRFLVGTSKMGARTIFRPAFSNWRTRNEDVEALAEVVVELGRKLAS